MAPACTAAIQRWSLPESVRHDVVQALIRVVPQREQLPELCNAMGGWICDRSSTNNNAITPAELFAAHGLDKATPIGDLLTIYSPALP